MTRLAIARIAMRWATEANLGAMLHAMDLDGGGSTVASPVGEVLFRLPEQEVAVAVFTLGARAYEWQAQP